MVVLRVPHKVALTLSHMHFNIVSVSIRKLLGRQKILQMRRSISNIICNIAKPYTIICQNHIMFTFQLSSYSNTAITNYNLKSILKRYGVDKDTGTRRAISNLQGKE